MNVLFEFDHGLGDAVQFTAVLKHLKCFQPEWDIDVAGLAGKTSAWELLCRETFELGSPSANATYDQRQRIAWWECHTIYSDSPSTKAAQCLRQVFGITPEDDFMRYQVGYNAVQSDAAIDYLESIRGGRPLRADDRHPVVAIHYEGNTSSGSKNVPHHLVADICREVISAGCVPMILDWDFRSPLPDGRTIHCPDVHHPLWKQVGTGDAAQLAALIDHCALFCGIDSGPQKVAVSTETPTIGIWTGHHPLQYCDLSDALHLVPASHRQHRLMQNEGARGYFESHYNFREYHNLVDVWSACLRERLAPADANGWMPYHDILCRSDNLEQDICVVRDILDEDSYRVATIDPLATEEIVVDVGAHIGCFARRWHRRATRSRIFCVEACPENIPLLLANAGGFAILTPAACTYETDVALMNAVYPDCESTGGSIVVPRGELREEEGYKADARPLETITLEELMQRFNLERIDCLKLDCEGSEFSILGNCEQATLDVIGMIVGEVHGLARFKSEILPRFQGWQWIFADDQEQTLVWLSNPRRRNFPGSLLPVAQSL